jgi:hypothetical protein
MLKRMKNFCYMVAGLIAISVLLLAGCAAKVAPPVENIANAELTIKEAEEGNAALYAPLELKIAEEKLEAAKQAMENEEYIKAKRLADEALIDAKLAAVKSQTKEARKMAEETRENVESLREEIEWSQK